MKRFFLAASAAAALFAANAASAAELSATINSASLGYKKQEVTIERNTVEGRATVAVQQDDVAIVMRSDGRDRAEINATTISAGFHEQDVTIADNHVSGDAAVVVQQGVLGVIFN
ncbi:hypothetical protein [Albimonas pacifica]|uniref:Uncharacterized protein n=1 Tax=Albimonas pacifica TaxID=1114924 RepID=A0A1I3Q102_9RHOB|nr:hypothetical protein [Albimonas pacifica]SFJ27320.1 hypothetical protein SAMN05216258_1243 [Albimonas pacifica]